ncbi:hypothetical protein [Bosea massiliensis]|uniref:Uncharacterized protein n=1 Tax=Bosea massiliensis TaxID=151419 RepID=A0ABW0PER0_9HYPH
METIIRNGCAYRVEIEHDEDMGPPWEEHDGHGIVSAWTRRDKAPGEVIIARDGASRRYYDVAETLAQARRDGWGLGPDGLAALASRLGRSPTRREVAAEAVRQDCDRMRQWCADVWHWCGVIVKQLDEDGEETGETRSLWGIESDSGDYLDTVAGELADEMESERADAMADDIAASRPDLSPESRA